MSEDQCPECGGTGIAGEVEHVTPVCCGNQDVAECCGQPLPSVEIEEVPCDACDGTGKRKCLCPEDKEAHLPRCFYYPGRKEATACAGRKEPAEKLAATDPGQDELPADLIDQAVEDARRGASPGVVGKGPIEDAISARVFSEVERAIREQGPLLIEAGAEQERERWKARIENLAVEWEYTRDLCMFGSTAYDRHSQQMLALRSLLTDEKPQGLEAVSGTKREWDESDEVYLDALSGEAEEGENGE